LVRNYPLRFAYACPLGKGAFLLETFQGKEALGAPYCYDLTLLSEDPSIPVDKVLGQRSPCTSSSTRATTGTSTASSPISSRPGWPCINQYETGDAAESDEPFKASYTLLDSHAQYRPRRTAIKPRIDGIQTALVVGPAGEEIYTDEYGRVRVQFDWDRLGQRDEKSSCWVRVSQVWAGKQWGAIHIPRIGQEVEGTGNATVKGATEGKLTAGAGTVKTSSAGVEASGPKVDITSADKVSVTGGVVKINS
jgi:uncharacterized protein involved in type VI secretion and phage assembly